MNQESLIWIIGLIVGILGILTSVSGLLPPEVAKWVGIVSALLTFVSGYLKNSPLPRTTWTAEERAANAAEGPK